MGDCHLGCWRQPELAALSIESFAFAIDFALKEKVDFVLVAGDLFDTAYPPIEVLKEAFQYFKKLKDSNIPVFIIAGSHDYSVSGKTFLDVLEKAGFAKNVFQPEYREDKIILNPAIYKNAAIYGYPGKKSGLEVPEIEKIKLHDSPGLFKILMLHTAIRDAVGTLPIPAVDETELPDSDYLALGHLHINYNKNGRIYCGPTFPANSSEIEELKHGSFYLIDTQEKSKKIEIKLKEVQVTKIEIVNAYTATDEIIQQITPLEIEDKIFLLKISGILKTGKKSDIDFNKIESFIRKKKPYSFLKSTSKIQSLDQPLNLKTDSENLEQDIIKKFNETHESKFNALASILIQILNTEKKEGEVTKVFEERLIEDANKVFEENKEIS